MSVPAKRRPGHDAARWNTIHSALDSTPRTLRLCLILLVTAISSAVGIATVTVLHAVLLVLLAK